MTEPISDSQTSALLEFRARNVRSFRGDVSFSLESTAMSEPQYVREIPWRKGGTRLSILAAAGVFGANASGKTNLLRGARGRASTRSPLLQARDAGRRYATIAVSAR